MTSARSELRARTRAETARDLPFSLEEFFCTHEPHVRSGEPRPRIFEDFAALSFEEAIARCAMMREVNAEAIRTHGEGEPWQQTWLPFAEDPGGGMLVADLETGHVFEYQCDGDGRERTLAASFDAFCELPRDAANSEVVAPPIAARRNDVILAVVVLALIALMFAAIAFVTRSALS